MKTNSSVHVPRPSSPQRKPPESTAVHGTRRADPLSKRVYKAKAADDGRPRNGLDSVSDDVRCLRQLLFVSILLSFLLAVLRQQPFRLRSFGRPRGHDALMHAHFTRENTLKAPLVLVGRRGFRQNASDSECSLMETRSSWVFH